MRSARLAPRNHDGTAQAAGPPEAFRFHDNITRYRARLPPQPCGRNVGRARSRRPRRQLDQAFRARRRPRRGPFGRRWTRRASSLVAPMPTPAGRRPSYLDKDPPHVAPIDGKEYADKRSAAKTRFAGLKKPSPSSRPKWGPVASASFRKDQRRTAQTTGAASWTNWTTTIR
jgi:hypothetical protein